MPVEEQVAVIYAVTEGLFDDINVDAILPASGELSTFLRSRFSGLLAQIADGGELPEEDLQGAIGQFKAARVAGEES